MFEVKLLVGVASICSVFSILACMIVLPQLYAVINEINIELNDSIQIFRIESNSAWSQLIDIQLSMTPPSKPRENPFNSIFRQKRYTKYARLPSWCQCEPIKLQCPPGPPGPPGEAGVTGVPGLPGISGKDSETVYKLEICSQADTSCIICPAGPPGVEGPPGPVGKIGSPGQPGESGQMGTNGKPGPIGRPGDSGLDGRRGYDGRSGSPGKNFYKYIPRPGSKGRPGAPGKPGIHGRPGTTGARGAPGERGFVGQTGATGKKGAPGKPGQAGSEGRSGPDAEYCPCPKRSFD